jgi:hypothetical protein
MEKPMKKFLSATLASTMLLSAPMAFAGGPVVIEEEKEVMAEKPASSVGILPIILITVGLCLALCGDDDETPPPNRG